MNVLVRSFCFIWMSLLWVYGQYTQLALLVRDQLYRRQILTSKVDPHAESVKATQSDKKLSKIIIFILFP